MPCLSDLSIKRQSGFRLEAHGKYMLIQILDATFFSTHSLASHAGNFPTNAGVDKVLMIILLSALRQIFSRIMRLSIMISFQCTEMLGVALLQIPWKVA